VTVAFGGEAVVPVTAGIVVVGASTVVVDESATVVSATTAVEVSSASVETASCVDGAGVVSSGGESDGTLSVAASVDATSPVDGSANSSPLPSPARPIAIPPPSNNTTNAIAAATTTNRLRTPEIGPGNPPVSSKP